jgi:hypothetical protein
MRRAEGFIMVGRGLGLGGDWEVGGGVGEEMGWGLRLGREIIGGK